VNARRLAEVLLALAGVAAVGAALGQASSATYSVPRQSIDGGAQRASSAS